MKQRYLDFDKLNRLLVASFEAEKLYYNAAQDAQTTPLKRFLNYMSVERNRMSHDISNELHARDIEPMKMDAEKGNLDRTWQDIKEAIENFNATTIINKCIQRDLNNIKRYDELIERKQLPDSIIQMLEKQRGKLDWYMKQAELQKETHFKSEVTIEESEKKKTTVDKTSATKVIPLKAI